MSDPVLYRRAVRLVVAGLLIENGLRVQLHVKKTLKKEPNECLLTIWNLSTEHRAAMQTKGAKMIVEAGYEQTIAQIFSGDVRYGTSTHDGPDWQTKVQSGDGERAYRWSTVEESFAPGVAVPDVFSKVAESTGLDVADAIATVRQVVQEQFTQGFTAFGRSSSELDRLLNGRGLEWSVQDGRLQVLETDKTTKASAILLSRTTGMVGSPEFGTATAKHKKKQTILKVKSLLMPGIKPGGTIRVESEAIQGNFKVITVEHSGDTHGGDWYSSCEAVPLG